jgi:hypothetical protein
VLGELVGQREHERDERVLFVGLDLQHVETDALGLAGLVQQPVALGLRQRRRDRILRDRLRSNITASCDRRPEAGLRLNILNSFVTGSK